MRPPALAPKSVKINLFGNTIQHKYLKHSKIGLANNVPLSQKQAPVFRMKIYVLSCLNKAIDKACNGASKHVENYQNKATC